MKKWLILTAAFLAACNTTPQLESNPDPQPQSNPRNSYSQSGWVMTGVGDFDHDGLTDDVLWRNYKTGENHVWIMDGATYQGSKILAPVTDLNWIIGGVGDMDGDGFKDDIIVRNQATLENRVLFMENYEIVNQASFTDGSMPGFFNNGGPVAVPSPLYEIRGAGDFNADGKSDIVWHSREGETAIWYMDGSTFLGAAALPRVPDMQWDIVGVGDMNGDGQSDLVWQHWPQPIPGTRTVDRLNSIWFMSGSAVSSNPVFQSAGDARWVIAAVGENNGDGKGDLFWRNDLTGDCVFWNMDGTTYLGGAYFGNVK
jgi:FG-GAP-like repeat